jgi:hypothetical protein
VIGGDAVHFPGGCGHPAENVAASHDHAYLDSGGGYLGYFASKALDSPSIDPEAGAARKSFTAELQQDARVSRHDYPAA